MASSNVAPSSMPYTPGNVVVVTHVVTPDGSQQPLRDKGHKFRKGHPKALGTVQIMIGVLTLLFGITTAINQPSLGVYSGIFVWGAVIYIASGSVTVAAEKTVSRCLINASLVLNIIATIVAVTGVILYALDPVLYRSNYDYDPYSNYHSYIRYYYTGYSVVVAVFQFLEFIIAVTVSAYACNATCCCCTEQTQVVVHTVEGQMGPQAPPHFQAASVAPALYPQVAPSLSSAEPPPYQPN